MKNLLLIVVFVLWCLKAVGQDAWSAIEHGDSIKLRELEYKIDNCYKKQFELTDSVFQLISQTQSDAKIKAIKLLSKLNNPKSVDFILENYEFMIFPNTNYEECCFPYANVIYEYVKSNLFLQLYKSTFRRDIISSTEFEKLKWIDYHHRQAARWFKDPYSPLEKLIIIDENRRNDYLLKYDSVAYKMERNLLLGLSNQSQLIRDSFAILIKKLLSSGENLVSKDNIIEHDNSFWKSYSSILPEYSTIDDLFKREKLNILKRSTLNGDSIYQVDNTHALIVRTEPKSGKIISAEAIEQIDFRNIEPSPSYTGIWRNYFINGEVNSAMSFENGVLSGSCYHYYPNGKLKSSSYYQDNTLVELREYDQEGLLVLKKKFINDKGGFETLKYDTRSGKVKIRKD
jgi:hypothetical protein